MYFFQNDYDMTVHHAGLFGLLSFKVGGGSRFYFLLPFGGGLAYIKVHADQF